MAAPEAFATTQTIVADSFAAGTSRSISIAGGTGAKIVFVGWDGDPGTVSITGWTLLGTYETADEPISILYNNNTSATSVTLANTTSAAGNTIGVRTVGDVTDMTAASLAGGNNPDSPQVSGLTSGDYRIAVFVNLDRSKGSATYPESDDQTLESGAGHSSALCSTGQTGITSYDPAPWTFAGGENGSVVTLAVPKDGGGPVQGSGSISSATSVSGTGEKQGEGSGTVSTSTSSSGTGEKIGQGAAPAIASATSVSGAGAKTGESAASVSVATSVSGAGSEVSGPVQGSGSISSATSVSGTGEKQGEGSGTVSTSTSVSGTGEKQGEGSGSVSSSTSVSGTGEAVGGGPVQGSGSIAVAVAVAGAGAKIGQGAGSVAVAAALAGAAGTSRTGSGALAAAVTISASGVRADAAILVDGYVTGRGYVLGEPFLNGIRTVRMLVQLAIGDGSDALWDSAIWGTDVWGGFDSSWLDVSDYVVQAKTKTGRSAANETFAAGTCSLRLLNTNGEWSLPGQGPGQIDIAPGQRLRVSIETAGGTEIVWTGFIDDIAETYGRRGEAYVDVSAFDTLARLGVSKLTGPLWSAGASPIVATRLALDAAGWPRGSKWRDISSAVVSHTLLEYSPEGESTVDVLRRIAAAEGGAIYVDKQGRPTLKGFGWLADTDGGVPSLTIDAAGTPDLDLRDIVPRRRNTRRVLNEARYRRLGDELESQTITAQDSGSKTLYGRRVAERFDFLTETTGQLQSLADQLVLYRAQPVAELQKVRLRPQTDAKALKALQADIGDVISVGYEHPQESWTWSQAANLVGIEHEIRKSGAWTVSVHADVTYQQGLGGE